jgi:hypothetical protein
VSEADLLRIPLSTIITSLVATPNFLWILGCFFLQASSRESIFSVSVLFHLVLPDKKVRRRGDGILQVWFRTCGKERLQSLRKHTVYCKLSQLVLPMMHSECRDITWRFDIAFTQPVLRKKPEQFRDWLEAWRSVPAVLARKRLWSLAVESTFVPHRPWCLYMAQKIR